MQMEDKRIDGPAQVILDIMSMFCGVKESDINWKEWLSVDSGIKWREHIMIKPQ